MLAENLDILRVRIEAARRHSPLAAASVEIIAASKDQGRERCLEALRAGVKAFGENRVQEAAAKWPELREAHPDIMLYLIGPLQTNKVKEAVRLFDGVQTLDRIRLADALAEEMAKQSRRLSCLIQINTGEEPQKAGIIPGEADRFIEYCTQELALPVSGLMCVPPADQPPAPHFALLRQIAKTHMLPTLSMGMSEDFETAVRMGATQVRLGRALMGARAAPADS